MSELIKQPSLKQAAYFIPHGLYSSAAAAVICFQNSY